MITEPQCTALIRIIRRIGKAAFRKHKKTLGIDESKTLLQLSKSEASGLINRIVNTRYHRRQG